MSQLPSLPLDIIKTHVVPLLSPEDLVAMSEVSKALNTAVKDYNKTRSYPFVLRERQLSTKMGYKQVHDQRAVYQVQRFQFLVQTEHNCVSVIMKLCNELWRGEDDPLVDPSPGIYRLRPVDSIHLIRDRFDERGHVHVDRNQDHIDPLYYHPELRPDRFPDHLATAAAMREHTSFPRGTWINFTVSVIGTDEILFDSEDYIRSSSAWDSERLDAYHSGEQLATAMSCVEVCAPRPSTFGPQFSCRDYIVQQLPTAFYHLFPFERFTTLAPDRTRGYMELDYNSSPQLEAWWRRRYTRDGALEEFEPFELLKEHQRYSLTWFDVLMGRGKVAHGHLGN